MPDRTHELRAALGDTLAAARQNLDRHPTPDDLLAYEAGELPEADQQAVEDHLVLCPECRELLLDVGCFSDPAFGAESAPSEMELAAAWRDLQPAARVAAEAVGQVGDDSDRSARERQPWARRFLRPPVMSLLAASFALATVGLSIWVGTLRRSLHELSQPQVNAAIHDFYGESQPRGRKEAPLRVTLPAGLEPVILILTPDQAPHLATVKIFAGDRQLWQQTGLKKNQDGSFTLSFTRLFLEAGDYRIELHDAETGTPIETIPLLLEPPEDRESG